MKKHNRKFRFTPSQPAPAASPVRIAPAVLTRDELRRIVAEMLG